MAALWPLPAPPNRAPSPWCHRITPSTRCSAWRKTCSSSAASSIWQVPNGGRESTMPSPSPVSNRLPASAPSNCPAACGGASTWPSACSASRNCCSSTNRPSASIRNRAASCSNPLPACRLPGRRCSTPATTWRKSRPFASASPSSTRARCWPRAGWMTCCAATNRWPNWCSVPTCRPNWLAATRQPRRSRWPTGWNCRTLQPCPACSTNWPPPAARCTA